jgi:hypothetical protein
MKSSPKGTLGGGEPPATPVVEGDCDHGGRHLHQPAAGPPPPELHSEGEFDCWESVMEFGLALPGTEASRSYGAPCVRVRGKAFLYPGREKGSFAVASPLEEKDFLIETDPDTFWETDHYRGGQRCWCGSGARTGSASKPSSAAPGGTG